MSIISQSTFLGNLGYFEIYEYHDKPCLFSCQNKAGHTFLALSVDETEDFDRWLYAPISLERLSRIKSGDIDLRNAFTQTEDNFVLDVKIFSDEKVPTSIETIACTDLTDDLLPVAGEFLNYDGIMKLR